MSDKVAVDLAANAMVDIGIIIPCAREIGVVAGLKDLAVVGIVELDEAVVALRSGIVLTRH